MRLLLVDGTNVVMRAAFGGEVEVERAVPVAVGMIERAAELSCATHLVVATDHAGPTWRHKTYPAYKGNRTVDTQAYSDALALAARDEGFVVVSSEGYEADDVIATYARRSAPRRVVIFSGDSDLCQLVSERVEVMVPGSYEVRTVATVCAKWGLERPAQLRDWKALVGEKGDNVPGVRGIGAVKATALLAAHGSLEAAILAGERDAGDVLARRVHEEREVALYAKALIALDDHAKVPELRPSECAIRSAVRG